MRATELYLVSRILTDRGGCLYLYAIHINGSYPEYKLLHRATPASNTWDESGRATKGLHEIVDCHGPGLWNLARYPSQRCKGYHMLSLTLHP